MTWRLFAHYPPQAAEDNRQPILPIPLPLSPSASYDALLLVSFGGPEGPDDVMPFLENVVRGKDVPRQRLLEVARHYELFDGVSPINGQNRALAGRAGRRTERQRAAVAGLLGQPQLASDAGRRRRPDGRRRRRTGLGVCHLAVRLLSRLPAVSRRHRAAHGRRLAPPRRKSTSSGCSTIIRASSSRRPSGWRRLGAKCRPSDANGTLLLFTAHSIPVAMAERSPYEAAVARGVLGSWSSQELAQCDLHSSQSGRPAPISSVGLCCLPKPQRAAVAGVARTGHPRSHPPVAGRGHPRRRRRADRFPGGDTWK